MLGALLKIKTFEYYVRKGFEKMEENSKNVTMEIRFRDLLSILKRCWWIMLAAAIVLGAAAYGFMHVTHKDQYTATATIWALGSNANGAVGSQTSSQDVQIAIYLINDYKELILTPSVLEKTLEIAKSDMSMNSLKARTKITNTDDSHVMYVSVTADDPKEARDIVNALSNEFCRRVNEKNKVENKDGEKVVERPLVSVWDEASTPKTISNPISLLWVALIAILGAVLVYVVFLILYLMDDKINTTDDVERYLGLNILGVIPNREDVRRRSMRKKAYYHYSAGQKSE